MNISTRLLEIVSDRNWADIDSYMVKTIAQGNTDIETMSEPSRIFLNIIGWPQPQEIHDRSCPGPRKNKLVLRMPRDGWAVREIDPALVTQAAKIAIEQKQ